MIEPVHPSAHSSPHSKRQMDRFSRFCTAYGRKWLYFTMGAPYPPELPLPMGDLDLPCNTWCFRPMRAHNQTAPWSVQACLHRWPWSVSIVYNGLPVSPSKLPLPMLASGPHVIRSSLGPPESGTQMVTLSFQPFLQGSLLWHTDRATERPTDRPRYSVRCGVIMHNYVGYGKANNFATINLLSRHVYVQSI